MMKKINNAAALVLMAGLIVAWLATRYIAESAPLDDWTVTAGSIKTLNSTSRPKIKHVKGSFELKSSLPQPGTRLSGACLIADLTDQGVGLKSCQTDQQCIDAYSAAPNQKLVPGTALYCLGDNPESSAKRCWIRPGASATHCTKNRFAPGSYAVPVEDTANPDASSVNADPLNNGKHVFWRVTACLNPAVFPPPPALPPCGDPASNAEVHSYGKVKVVNP